MSDFPIMSLHVPKAYDEFHKAGVERVRSIPWAMILPHEKQAARNHYQTLRRLAERGGLSATEALAVLEDRNWHSMTEVAAHTKLRAIVLAWEPKP